MEINNKKIENGELSKLIDNRIKNLFESKQGSFIQEKFSKYMDEPSDINELLIYLYEYSFCFSKIVEFGTRSGISTISFIRSLLIASSTKIEDIDEHNNLIYKNKNTFLTTYDINKHPNIDEIERELEGNEFVDFKFIQANVLNIEIEETDILFIDTYHTASQLEKELSLHSKKVKHRIILHDTTTFWETGEQPYPGLDHIGLSCGRGLKYAVEPFLENNPEWKVIFRTEKNNGLMVLERNTI